LLLVAALLADLSGVLRPLPHAETIIAEMRETWRGTSGYAAEVSVGDWGGGASGAPDTCRQRYWRTPEQLVLATQDLAGFRHVERWTDGLWSYYQPGAEVQFNIRLDNADAVSLSRWFASQYPTLGDLVHVITDSNGARTLGRDSLTTGPAWTLECRPEAPTADFQSQSPSLAGFYSRFLGRTWKVWVSQQTHLPAHIWVSSNASEPVTRISVDNLELGAPAQMDDWRELLGSKRGEARQLTLRADFRAPHNVDAVREEIRRRVDVWRAPLLHGGSYKR
jgi:hypothetical protein